MNTENGISKATVARLPAYLRYLKGARAKGVEYVSSAVMASDMGYSAVGVRKDLEGVSSKRGKPRFGFEIAALIADIEKFLGYKQTEDVIIVGAGALGRAILSYDGFEKYGIRVVAAFDRSPTAIGAVRGKPVYPMERLRETVERHKVKAGILAVPRASAQGACDEMIGAGITQILSFAAEHLRVPTGVEVRYEDLAASLAALCNGN